MMGDGADTMRPPTQRARDASTPGPQRERKAEREAEAELDRLTVGQRVSVQLARQLPTALVGEIIQALAQQAREGKVQSARELRSWLALAGLDTGDAPADMTPIEDMTPEQRAVLRARLLRDVQEQLDQEEEQAEQSGEGHPPER